MNDSAEIAVSMSHGGMLEREGASRPDLRTEFAAVAREHGPGIFGLALRFTSRREDAEDLLQETFLKAWKGLGRFRGKSEVRTWLIRILVNAARDRFRRRPPPRVLQEAPSSRTDPAEGLSRKELLGRVMTVIQGLPRRQREALLLRARGGLPYREIAEVMGIRVGAVKAHLVQARRKLVRICGREVAEWTKEKS